MSSPSKMVVDRKKSADAVKDAAEKHQERIVTELTRALGGPLADAARAIIVESVKVMDTRSTDLLRADRAHTDELADDAPARKERDEAALAVYGKLSDDRRALEGLVGMDYVRRVGFDGPTPKQPHMLLELAQTVQRRIRETPAPASKVKAITFEPAAWAAEYEPLLTSLDAALAKVGGEEREAEGTLRNKQIALDEHDRAFTLAAGLVSLLLDAAGEHDLARRVRPSARRAGVTTEVDEQGEGGTPAGDGGVDAGVDAGSVAGVDAGVPADALADVDG